MDKFSNAKPLPPTFPLPMMEYITKNPPRKPQAQLKLIKTCKFFFQKHPILPVNSLAYEYGGFRCRFGSCDRRNLNLLHIDPKIKFWAFDGFIFENLNQENQDFFIALKSRIYRCSLAYLDLSGITLTQDEWKFLVAGEELRDLMITYCIVKNSNDEIMPLENMLAYVNGKIRDVRFTSNRSAYYTPLTFKKLGLHFTNLKRLYLIDIIADLDPDDVAQFTKEHTTAKFSFEFDRTYPEARKIFFMGWLSVLTHEWRSRIRMK